MEVTTRAREAARLRQRAERRGLWFLIGPTLFWLGVFFLLPLMAILVVSFLKRGAYGGIIPTPNIENYVRLLDADYFIIFRRSFVLALGTTLFCLLVGYPMAYFITQQNPRWRNILVILVIIPFWTNFLVRTYAWMDLLRDEGVINTALLNLGLIRYHLDMLFTPGAVLVGMVYGFLPFMILPVYANLEKFDWSLMEAAYDAGANHLRAFLRVMLPLTMPGIVAGAVLVFIPAIGTFITSDLLGGQKVMLIGNLIDRQFSDARHWPFASAISITLMVMVSIGVALYYRVTTEEDRL